MIMGSPAASAEPIGPIAIIRRSWTMTGGHWWRLFGFLILFLVGAGILLIAVSTVAGTIVSLFLGPLEPLSASALVTSLIEAVFQAAVSVIFAMMLARIYAQLSGRDAQPSVPSSGT
jgi:ABC-type Fe3+ transport system permease subunit